MKLFIAALFALLPLSASANIEFLNRYNWTGQTEDLILEFVGILATNGSELSVTLNFEKGKQLKFTGTDAPAGLALIPFQGKCVRVFPREQWRSAGIITHCN